MRFRAAQLALGLLLLLSACGNAPEQLTATVVETYPHDPAAFTQGLLMSDGRLFESTGLYGQSTLREVDLTTGEVLRQRRLTDDLFGEGLALVEDRLIQLTWRAGAAFVYDRDTFELVGSFSYEGEGWGLCFDGEQLWMTDGSATLTARDPDTFGILNQVIVRHEDEPVTRLNELECRDGNVYANVWFADEVVRIDPRSGEVTGIIDASQLLPAQQREALGPDAVLNGIAFNEATGNFLLTGKLWPTMFEVRFE